MSNRYILRLCLMKSFVEHVIQNLSQNSLTHFMRQAEPTGQRCHPETLPCVGISLFYMFGEIIAINGVVKFPNAHYSLPVCECFRADGDWASGTWHNGPYKDCYVSRAKCGIPPHWQTECRLNAHSSNTQKHLWKQSPVQHRDTVLWHTNITDEITVITLALHSYNSVLKEASSVGAYENW